MDQQRTGGKLDSLTGASWWDYGLAQRTGNVLKAAFKLWSLDTSSLGIIWKPLEMQILVYPEPESEVLGQGPATSIFHQA